MTTYAILTAAGSGSRLGFELPKAFVPLHGVPLVVHAARNLLASGAVDGIIVTAPASHAGQMRAVLDAWEVAADVVVGGPSRQASVACGLDEVPPKADVVIVHDAARALAPADLIARIVAEVHAGRDGVIPVLAVTDTIKRIEHRTDPEAGTSAEPRDHNGAVRIQATVPRADLRIVQTPQGFRADVLRSAHAGAREQGRDETRAATDDAALLEAAGHDVWAVAGDERAMKITTAHDLAVAGLLLT